MPVGDRAFRLGSVPGRKKDREPPPLLRLASVL
jgi:hypothetical protein